MRANDNCCTCISCLQLLIYDVLTVVCGALIYSHVCHTRTRHAAAAAAFSPFAFLTSPREHIFVACCELTSRLSFPCSLSLSLSLSLLHAALLLRDLCTKKKGLLHEAMAPSVPASDWFMNHGVLHVPASDWFMNHGVLHVPASDWFMNHGVLHVPASDWFMSHGVLHVPASD